MIVSSKRLSAGCASLEAAGAGADSVIVAATMKAPIVFPIILTQVLAVG
ncbi:hypothetical protein [Lysobacter sp. Hz 25]